MIVQLCNPRTKRWMRIDKAKGVILQGRKITPYKNVKIVTLKPKESVLEWL